MSEEQSLAALPTEFWNLVCQFLPHTDLWHLYHVGGNPQRGCIEFFSTMCGNFNVFSSNSSPCCSPQTGSCSTDDLLLMEGMGTLYNTVRFTTDCFYIESQTFISIMSAFADPQSQLKELSLLITDGFSFMTGRHTGRHDCDWLRFLHACETSKADLNISAEVIFQELASAVDIVEVMSLSLSDHRYRYATNLCIEDMFKSVDEDMLRRMHNLGPTPLTVSYISRCPNLQCLQIQGINVDALLLRQLTQMGDQLKNLFIYFDPDLPINKPLQNISNYEWTRLRNACPNLKVECFALERDVALEVLQTLIKPCAPVSYLGARIDDEHNVESVLQKCQAFSQSLHYLSLVVSLRSATGLWSRRTELAVQDFVTTCPQFRVRYMEETEDDGLFIIEISRRLPASSRISLKSTEY